MICYRKTQLKDIGPICKRWQNVLAGLKAARQSFSYSYFHFSTTSFPLIFESFILISSFIFLFVNP
jgi:hypothetical protein